jgi:hypothetical protein
MVGVDKAITLIHPILDVQQLSRMTVRWDKSQTITLHLSRLPDAVSFGLLKKS